MADEKSNVVVELYDLSITERKDDRFGRVLTTRTDKVDDLIRIAVTRRTDLNAVTLKASYDILKSIALEEVANGASVEFGLGYHSLDVNGTFWGDHAKWDPAQHSLHLRMTPTAEARDTVKKTAVNVRGMAVSGVVVNSVKDVYTGAENSVLTPGRNLKVFGQKLRIAGDNPAVGVWFVSLADNSQRTQVDVRDIVDNNPSQLTVVVPDLPAGDYLLEITTQSSSGNTGTLLKEPRTFRFEIPLTV